MAQLITLQAKRFKNQDGSVSVCFYKRGNKFAQINTEGKRLNRNTKTIVINCFRWKIEWVS